MFRAYPHSKMDSVDDGSVWQPKMITKIITKYSSRNGICWYDLDTKVTMSSQVCVLVGNQNL
jgi:hypothetical protein